MLYPGAVTRATWDAISERLVTRDFSHPAYWRVGGRPYFSIYDLERFRIGLGGIGPARAALDALRERAAAAGLPGVHLNAVIWSTHLLPGESAVGDPPGLVRALGLDSLTSYVWVHHAALVEFPETDYDVALARYLRYWDAAAARFDTPYFPNVTVGWDPSPCTVQSDAYLNAGYPFTPVLAGATPERFEAALRAVAARWAGHPHDQRVERVDRRQLPGAGHGAWNGVSGSGAEALTQRRRGAEISVSCSVTTACGRTAIGERRKEKKARLCASASPRLCVRIATSLR